MAQRKKLTVAGIERIKPPTTGRAEYLDTVVPQLALRVTHNGVKSFAVRTRVKGRGKQIRVTLGNFPAVSLSDARDAARDALTAAKRGVDPNQEKRLAEIAQKERQANDFAAVAELFVERYAKKRGNRTWRETQRILDKYVVPRWGDRPIAEIRKRDVVDLLDHVEDNHGFYMANRTLAAVRKLFNWAMDERDLIQSTPVGRNMARGKERKRDRVLQDGEIAALWAACDGLGYPLGAVLRLLLLTGQRRAEIGEMQWNEVDFDAAVWTVPARRSKNEKEHVVHLSPAALDIMEDLPRFSGPYVFSTTDGHRPVSGFSKFKARADNASGITDWRLHDLRRTCRTGLAALGVPEIVAEKILNHETDNPDLARTYDRHDYMDERRDALNRWALRVQQIVEPQPSNVIAMAKR